MAKQNVNVDDRPTMELSEKLSRIQFEFKAKKGQYNSFGKYKFRSAEDILEALKPINYKYKVYFTINENLINSNPPIIVSVATIWDCESSSRVDCQAVVGVDLEQKGMAMPQRYGSTSSYGKKYALGNLLLIDDTADADATNTHGKTESKKIVLEKDTDLFKKISDYLQTENADKNLVLSKYEISSELKTLLNL
jgi:hypothetical protein